MNKLCAKKILASDNYIFESLIKLASYILHIETNISKVLMSLPLPFLQNFGKYYYRKNTGLE